MGDNVERALEETVPILQAAKRAKLLTPHEVDEVVRKRRNHEYALRRKDATRAEYLKYASFERELSKLLQKRADKRRVKKKTVQLIVGKTSSRANLVYSRAVKTFRGDVDLWLHYARHCVKTGSIRTAQRVLARAIAYRGDSERIWLAAVALHFDTCSDAKGARTLAQRALRAIPHSGVLWKEYFRLEVSYLSKLIIRRLAIGLKPTPPSPGDQDIPKLGPSENDGSDTHAREIQHTTDDPDGMQRSDAAEEDSRELDRDPISENPKTEARSEDESSESSESEMSEEESTSNASQSSDEESDDSDENENHRQRLSFWEGGVPMTVFRRACNGMNLSAAALLDFWMIAVSSPYIPTQLLRGMSMHVRKHFPSNIMSQLIEARLEWDCTRTDCGRHRYTEGDLHRDVSSIDSFSNTESETNKRAVDDAKALIVRLGNALRSSRISNMSDSERMAVAACIQNIVQTMKTTPLDMKMIYQTNALLKTIDQGKSEGETIVLNQNANNEASGLRAGNWSVAALGKAITQGKAENGVWQSGDVVTAVIQKAGIPFRDIHHDKVIAQFLEIETDIESIQAISEVLLSTPPLTMQGIRHMIAAEMRILDLCEIDSPSQPSQKTMIRLRRLFAKGEPLSGTRHDVDFWLLFLDFERRKAKDPRAAAVVHAKALRTLTREKAVLFTELHSLRNLT